jgi:opacity protein-like surface antigen
MKTTIVVMMALFFPYAAVLASNSMSVSQEFDAQYSYVGDAKTRGAGLSNGSIDEQCADVKYVISPQVTKDLLLRFGFEWQRFSFDVPDHTAVPRLLQQASGVLGFDYQVADQWLMRMEVEPGIYSDFRDISWRDFDAPLVLGAVYLADADIQWFFGLRMDVRSEYPVLPVAGVRWKLSDEWTLNFMLPNPRVEYEINERLLLYLGGGIEAGTFAVGEHFGSDHGQPKLDGAIVDYMELRLNAGCSWKITPRVTIEAEAGYMPYREFEFFTPNIEFRSYNTPYGQIACHARF